MLAEPGEETGNHVLPSRKADIVCKQRLLGSWLQSGSDINISISRPLLDARLLVWGLMRAGLPGCEVTGISWSEGRFYKHCAELGSEHRPGGYATGLGGTACVGRGGRCREGEPPAHCIGGRWPHPNTAGRRSFQPYTP